MAKLLSRGLVGTLYNRAALRVNITPALITRCSLFSTEANSSSGAASSASTSSAGASSSSATSSAGQSSWWGPDPATGVWAPPGQRVHTHVDAAGGDHHQAWFRDDVHIEPQHSHQS